MELGGPAEVLEVGEGEGMGVLPSAVTTSPPRVGTGCLLPRWGVGCAPCTAGWETGGRTPGQRVAASASCLRAPLPFGI